MRFSMFRPGRLLVPLSVLVVLFALACADDDDGGGASATPVGSLPTGATAAPVPVVPPMEGPGRGEAVAERTDFRADPAWRMPSPDSVPPADDPDDPVLNPPADPECPADWTLIQRPVEGFQICHPSDWTVAGHGYVSSPNEDQWYTMGIFDFVDESQSQRRAHVSIYVLPDFVKPFRYTLDCPEPRSVTLSGQPAVVCPDFPASPPEARIVSYHVFREDYDYFVQVVSYYHYDQSSGTYTDDVEEEAFDKALEIAHTFEFTPVTPLNQ